MTARSIEILLVEDSPADVAFTREALDDARLLNHLHVVDDGEQALKYLRREPPFSDAKRPDMVLLDLDLPRVDGREVLAVVKADPDLQDIPIVVLTNSILREDVERAYATFANCYIVKPVDRLQFMEAIRRLKRFWVDVVRLPSDRSL